MSELWQTQDFKFKALQLLENLIDNLEKENRSCQKIKKNISRSS